MTCQEGISMVSDSGKNQWFALQVRGRHERLVSTALTNKGYESFLPTYQNWEGSKRRKYAESPLFPGYLFCRFDAFRRLPILVTPGVIHIVGIGREPVAIDEIEVFSLMRIVDENLQAEPVDFFQIGERVRIVEGPLCGVEGILIDRKGSLQLILSVTLLGRSVRVEINKDRVIASIPSTQPLARLLNKSQSQARC
jgi:transcription antitermination factor NusG